MQGNTNSSTVFVADVVKFEYKELLDTTADYADRIEKAFGPKGLGICIVNGVPDYVEKRAALLPLSQKLATLPKEDLEAITYPDIHYSLGWSHGKEKFKGREDYSKGSFYANAQQEDRIPKWEGSTVSKLDPFPKAIPELKEAFKSIGQLMIDTGLLLAYHLDKYVQERSQKYEAGKMVRIIKESDTIIGRLLHYFPRENLETSDPWCGMHNDLGSLTGLCGAMYLDKDGKVVDFSDEESGLHILSREGKEFKAKIPKDSLAFQTGETMQIHTGGLIQATPHFVKIGNKIAGTGISRNTLAVFMEPRHPEPMNQPEGVTMKETIGTQCDELPELEKRWKENQIFKEFHDETLKAFL
jgi:isopenicillin N synthase-like dioxygenase